jgi:lipopolysaccharide/colanic/teichoic acid biosynthesis glycosyltransferase
VATLRQEFELEVTPDGEIIAPWRHRRTAPVEAAAPWAGQHRLQLGIKRFIDVAGALAALMVLFIPSLVMALIIKIESRGPVLLRQVRVGAHGRVFLVYKFRTMCDQADQMLSALQTQNEQQGPLFKMRKDPRMTRVGRWLRKTSIDEWPQFINVLRGEMSLVGPRPPLPWEVAAYTEHQLGRLAVRPGITGLWQVRGRSTLTFDEMVELDLEYIERWSVWRDAAILLKTVPAVISTRGAW